MRNRKALQFIVEIFILVGFCSVQLSFANGVAKLSVNASKGSGRKIPDTLFGVFFEEINHAGAGGLWAELVRNRGFEIGSTHWGVIGDNTSIQISTEPKSCFEHNNVALKMDVLCDNCPAGGVGIYNPGFWGMNIKKNHKYNMVFYAHSSVATNITASLTDASGSITLASASVKSSASYWTRHEFKLKARGTNDNARLQLTVNSKATIWFDQVSLMPKDTYLGHGFRKDLLEMVLRLKPAFVRIPGGCFVEGVVLKNAFRWRDTVVPWQERPGHYNDIWNYWTDDGLGYFEYLQLAEDLGAAPIWIFNSGNSHHESVEPQLLDPYVQDALDGLEFAMGPTNSRWGSVRAKMGHPKPFDIPFVGIGNEDCGLPHYNENYKIIYDALKKAYPGIKLISNCDGSKNALPHPADYYDFHVYTDANRMFNMAHEFDKAPRLGPKAFVSEYAVYGPDAKTGTLLGALGEAGFLIGLENNSDLVELASYAPLFTNVNNRAWDPDAIAFNSSHLYGTPSYYMQLFFSDSNGATLLGSTLESNDQKFIANAIQWIDGKTKFLRVKAVNFDGVPVSFTIHFDGANLGNTDVTKMELTSANVMDENSLNEPFKIVPVKTTVPVVAGKDTVLDVVPHSIISVDFPLGPVS